MDSKSRDRLAIAFLVAAKVFGIAGLALGVTAYRNVGGALLAFDGALLLGAVALVLKNLRANVTVENGHKAALRQMIAEGTLAQYLVDVRTDGLEAAE